MNRYDVENERLQDKLNERRDGSTRLHRVASDPFGEAHEKHFLRLADI